MLKLGQGSKILLPFLVYVKFCLYLCTVIKKQISMNLFLYPLFIIFSSGEITSTEPYQVIKTENQITLIPR